jgi:hypothetical protein
LTKKTTSANPTSYQKQGHATLWAELVLSMQRPYCYKQIGRIGKVKRETGKYVDFDDCACAAPATVNLGLHVFWSLASPIPATSSGNIRSNARDFFHGMVVRGRTP